MRYDFLQGRKRRIIQEIARLLKASVAEVTWSALNCERVAALPERIWACRMTVLGIIHTQQSCTRVTAVAQRAKCCPSPPRRRSFHCGLCKRDVKEVQFT